MSRRSNGVPGQSQHKSGTRRFDEYYNNVNVLENEDRNRDRSNRLNNEGPKRDKISMVRKNNDKIAQRGLDDLEINHRRHNHRLNVDRIMLERQMTQHNFGSMEENDNNMSDESNDDDQFIGEVTGEQFDTYDIFDKGMPVRSSFTVKKARYDNNSHLDFDLFDKVDKKSVGKIAYSDGGGEYADLDEAMKSITDSADPYEICISNVNSTTCWLHSNMYVCSKEDYVVNGFGLFSSFGVIYMISKGNTELELKNYFDFQDKKHLNAGLLTLRDDLNHHRDQIVIDNYLINDKRTPSKIDVAKKLKSLIFNVVINRDYADHEAERVNKIINTVSGMKDVVSSETLSRSNISLVLVARLNPIWKYEIENIVKARFRGNYDAMNSDSDIIDFIRFLGKTFDHYEDAEKQVIEIPMHGDVFAVGMILSKVNTTRSTDLKCINTSINYLKPTVMDEVLIPVIQRRFKTRLNKTLQKTGLNMVFSQQEMIGMFPEGGSFDDCIQYVDIKFGTRSSKKNCNNRGYRTTRKFIANREFEFYLRNTKTNCIMMMGRI
jgi:serine protease inhibitor